MESAIKYHDYAKSLLIYSELLTVDVSSPLKSKIHYKQAMNKKITLHQEMLDILDSIGNEWLTMQEMADWVNKRSRYCKRDGSQVESNQISARASKYPQFFERLNGKLRRK